MGLDNVLVKRLFCLPDEQVWVFLTALNCMHYVTLFVYWCFVLWMDKLLPQDVGGLGCLADSSVSSGFLSGSDKGPAPGFEGCLDVLLGHWYKIQAAKNKRAKYQLIKNNNLINNKEGKNN